jgi:phosphate transport system permease protein
MTDLAMPVFRTPTDWNDVAMRKRIDRRYAAERRFRFLGLAAVLVSAGFLAFLLFTMIGNGIQGFVQAEIKLTVDLRQSGLRLDPATLDSPAGDAALAAADIEGLVRASSEQQYGRGGSRLLSDSAWLTVRRAIKAEPALLSGHPHLLAARRPTRSTWRSRATPRPRRRRSSPGSIRPARSARA